MQAVRTQVESRNPWMRTSAMSKRELTAAGTGQAALAATQVRARGDAVPSSGGLRQPGLSCIANGLGLPSAAMWDVSNPTWSSAVDRARLVKAGQREITVRCATSRTLAKAAGHVCCGRGPEHQLRAGTRSLSHTNASASRRATMFLPLTKISTSRDRAQELRFRVWLSHKPPGGLTESVQRVGSKSLKVILRERRALLVLHGPSTSYGRHSTAAQVFVDDFMRQPRVKATAPARSAPKLSRRGHDPTPALTVGDDADKGPSRLARGPGTQTQRSTTRRKAQQRRRTQRCRQATRQSATREAV